MELVQETEGAAAKGGGVVWDDFLQEVTLELSLEADWVKHSWQSRSAREQDTPVWLQLGGVLGQRPALGRGAPVSEGGRDGDCEACRRAAYLPTDRF